MTPPDLVYYDSSEEYRKHYERNYVRSEIYTFDKIRVYFDKQRFGHVFWESSDRSGRKDIFCEERAQRIDWIKATLENESADLYFGWDSQHKKVETRRRVSIVYESFIVVIELGKKRTGAIKAKFITAFLAENRTLTKITNSPKWNISDIDI